MGIEIERKFLVNSSPYLETATGIACRQGYIYSGNGTTVRVRIMDSTAYLTIKGKGKGIAKSEYEYEIPLADANEMLEQLCRKPLIEKVRYKIPYGGFTWEVDHFAGENKGLVMAEIELEHEDQQFEKPQWVGQEVTGDQRYYNAVLQQRPYTSW